MPALVGIVIWSALVGALAVKKGRNFLAYFALSFVISPLITGIILLCLKNLNNTDTGQLEAGTVEPLVSGSPSDYSALPDAQMSLPTGGSFDNRMSENERNWAQITATVSESQIRADINTALMVYNQHPTQDVLDRIAVLNPQAAAGIRSVLGK